MQRSASPHGLPQGFRALPSKVPSCNSEGTLVAGRDLLVSLAAVALLVPSAI
jgi:hypothetical protein